MDIVLGHLPQNLDEMKALPYSSLELPESADALPIVVMCHYMKSPEDPWA